MKSKSLIIVLLASLLAVLSGCASDWKHVEPEPYSGPLDRYRVQLPLGWKIAPLIEDDHVIVAEKGLSLSQIHVLTLDLDEAFTASPETEDFSEEQWLEMLPDEVADLELRQTRKPRFFGVDDEPMDSDGFLLRFGLASSNVQGTTLFKKALKAVVVAGRPAFELVMEGSNQWGLPFTVLATGFIHEGRYILLQYSAPSLYFFEKDLPEYRAMVKTFELREKCYIFCG